MDRDGFTCSWLINNIILDKERQSGSCLVVVLIGIALARFGFRKHLHNVEIVEGFVSLVKQRASRITINTDSTVTHNSGS